ncbi:PTS sugar transporter subunit IIA [uncultured Tateyamaria sp.]|uniref:PTS sugar transporter subunit IIA n=1 Tax=uncultured Tateyamaria sp. TaxID=455651 RepID=UPI002620A071|nr:PTS sugar transporter subunit IIA [uncultured Tateyamaria sp.]
MNFGTLLKPEAVKVVTSASSKKRLFHEIGDLVQSAYDLNTALVVESLIAREALGPTGVGHGVALPHARLDGISDVMGAFVLLDKPIDFDAVDRQPVDIAFALFAPEEAGVEHLKALALVSRTLRDAAICNKLRANPDASTLFAILNEAKPAQAA